MIITDFAHNLRQANRLIELIDRPGQTAAIRFVPVKHRDAAKLVTEVTSLLGKKRTVAGKPATPAGMLLSTEARTNRIVMVHLPGAETEALELMELLDVATDAETRTYRFQYVQAQRVDKRARELALTEHARLLYKSTTDAEGNALIVTAPPEVHEQIAAIQQQLDVKPDTQTRQYLLKHLGPDRLDRMIRDLMEHDIAQGPYKSTIDAEGAMLTVTAAPDVHERLAALQLQYDVKPDTTTRTYYFEYVSPERIDKLVRDMTEHDEVKPAYKSTIDAESGRLIVTSTTIVHERIDAVTKEVDVPGQIGEMSHVRFYKLLNTTASAVLATIRSLDVGDAAMAELGELGDGGTDGIREAASARDAGAGSFTGPNVPVTTPVRELPKPPAYREPKDPSERTSPRAGSGLASQVVETSDAKVTIDQNTNSIIVVAPPEVQRIYKQLIAMLDRRRPQVIIEITMVTLDTSGNFSLGVELSRAGDHDDSDRYLTFSSFGLSTTDMDTGALTLKPGIGFNGVLVGVDTLNVVVRALEANGRSKVLSAPKILVNDNATASMSSVSEAPFTSVNASNTVSTTSFAGYASAGTTVSVTPHISEGDHLQLDYSLTLNSFTGEGGGSIPPPRQTNTISSQVTIPAGQAVIVGGMTREDVTESFSSVPFLGRVPVLKHLLGNQADTNAQSTLFVFIRPMILRDDQFEDLKYFSDRELAKAKMPPNYPASEPIVMP